MRVRCGNLSLAGFILVLFTATVARAQTGSLAGRVIDIETRAPLPNARVEAVAADGRIAGSAFTDPDGRYRIANLSPGTYALAFTLLGYETRRLESVRLAPGESPVLVTELTSLAFRLNPIVVSASKRSEKTVDAPASVAVVDGRRLAEQPATTPADHLRGLSGVDIVTQGVQSTNVVTRGFNNIFSGSLHALTDNRIAGVPSLEVNLLHFVPANDDDIERMEVVLGPGAALYGPNTADGVLHILTKSPIDYPGSSISIAGGERSLLHLTFRTASRLSDRFGIKLSGQYLSADEWCYTDPVEQAEAQKFASDPFYKQDLMNALRIDDAEADRRIARIGKRDFDLRRWSGELRADWRPAPDLSAVLTAGITQLENGIELTGLGAGQAKDWRYTFVQARANWRRLFAQAYVDMSDAGETYLLRNGAPIVDRSKLYVAQLQHGFSLGERQDFTYGLDLLYTNPVTEGSIDGKYEDDDQTTEFGAYVQSKTSLTDRLSLVLAGRLDTHSALPEAIFSPRAALVFKPTETQAFRLTFNRAFSTPSSLNQFLDLASAIPDSIAAKLGYSLRIQGTGTAGFHFRQPDGTYLMRSPFTLGPAGPAQPVQANAAAYWRAAVAVLQQAGAIDATTAQYLDSLSTAALTAISSNYFHPGLGTGRLADLALPDVEPIRESTSTTFEAGYRGVLGERFLLAVDVWYSKRENFVTPLTVTTPFVTLNPQETIAFLTQRFMSDRGMSQAQAQAQAMMLACGATDGTCPRGLATIPLGVITSPEVDANGAQLLTTYFNVEDELDLYGLDVAATALLSGSWSVGGTLSLVNEDVFDTERGEKVTLNAPKTKGSISVAYRGIENGFNAEVRARYNDDFPVRSGVYNGTLCIGGTEPGAEDCVKSYTLLDLVAGYRLRMIPGASIQLSIQNLLDEDYRSFPGVPTIGRMALVRLKYEF